MGIPVIVEPVDGDRYRVTGAGGPSVGRIAEGSSAGEAIGRPADQVRTHAGAGPTLAELDVAAIANADVEAEAIPAPWKQDAGYLRDDPLYEPWRAAIEDYRRRLDANPSA